MKRLAALAIMASMLASASVHANQTNVSPLPGATPSDPGEASSAPRITRVSSQPSIRGSGDYFTGSMRVDPLFPATAPSRTSGGSVTFEPGARTAWHTHPLGQTLVVTAGLGWMQQWGGPVEEIRPGDVVWIPPGVKHWHGATPTTGMTHIAITDHLDGRVAEWMEKVTDDQYRR
jgi:quercetin dioxygenase-like cupin family protein